MIKHGLGKNPEASLGQRGRGRKYLFSKAQNKSLADVAAGKQLSIFGALRAVKPQEGFPP
jgi:hypothetical protein